MILLLIFTLSTLLILGGCSNNNNQPNESDQDKLKIVATYSIIYDIAKNIAGDEVIIHSLAPIGSNPHEYDPLPNDVKNTTDADVVFYNGLNLEQGNSWFKKLIETAGKSGEGAPVYMVSEGVDAIQLESKGLENQMDPHAWLDITNGIKYAENIREALIEVDPDNASKYRDNADNYIKELEALHKDTIEKIKQIPEAKRFLITSEGAFKYFGRAYGLETGYIWEINAENQGSPQQIRAVVDLIRDKGIKALFIETSIDRRSMETVSDETEVPIVGTVYTDSLGAPGTDGDTYLKMMQVNTSVIIDGLSKQ
ncbi:MAG TPA: metal ABC transporter substrate-binding protein [Bacilli bacterium]